VRVAQVPAHRSGRNSPAAGNRLLRRTVGNETLGHKQKPTGSPHYSRQVIAGGWHVAMEWYSHTNLCIADIFPDLKDRIYFKNAEYATI
jgi:hypothetical protein